MSVKFPQFDLPRGVSGASDLWDDDGAAGQILRADYFTQVAPVDVRVHWAQLQVPAAGAVSGTQLEAWTGSAWVTGTLKRWNGSSWEAAALKRWNGSGWVTA